MEDYEKLIRVAGDNGLSVYVCDSRAGFIALGREQDTEALHGIIQHVGHLESLLDDTLQAVAVKVMPANPFINPTEVAPLELQIDPLVCDIMRTLKNRLHVYPTNKTETKKRGDHDCTSS